MEEIWKPVKNFENLYEISNLGRVKSHHKYGGLDNRIMKQKINRYGYSCVKLSNRGHTRHVQVHRLVAETFLENPNDFPMINHKDENKLNNHVENLEWCNAQYNNTYGHRLEKAFPKAWEKWSYTERGRAHMSKVGKARGKRCASFKDGKMLKEFASAAEAARYYNIKKTHVVYCCEGKSKARSGMQWKYL